MSLEGDVELADLGITWDSGVSSTLEGLDGVVGQFASSGIVTGNGSCGGNVVGDRADLLVGRSGTVGHHIAHVGDGVTVEVSLRG